jgi:NADPH:quinone reductase
MRAVVIAQYGGPEQLVLQDLPEPQPEAGRVIIEIKAFGINHAEIYFRKGIWGDVAKVSGIECVGLVKADPSGQFGVGQKVAALMGGMGRTFNGSYAEYSSVPRENVVAIETDLSWEELAALPESYATAWICLRSNLALSAGETLLVRGATSALGQAAVNIAAELGASVFATTRNPNRFATLREIGADEVLLEGPDLGRRVREICPCGVDAVSELVGNSTLLDSLTMPKRNGRVCMAGFLGGGDPIASFNPLLHMPSGVHLSFFASAFTFGKPEYPLGEIPFQTIVDLAAAGTYKAKPARVFRFEEIQDSHRLMESNQANGKIVVVV